MNEHHWNKLKDKEKTAIVTKNSKGHHYKRIKHIVEKQKSTDILYGDALLNPDNAQN